MIVGYSISKRMTVDIIINSLIMAKVTNRLLENAIFHSDRGSQYTSKALKRISHMLSIRLSTGRTGSCHDNAVAESLFSSMKREAVSPLLISNKQNLNSHTGYITIIMLDRIQQLNTIHPSKNMKSTTNTYMKKRHDIIK
jgi:transposase InsO family protein